MSKLKIEFMKIKRRGVWFVLLALWAVQTMYLFWGTYNVEDFGEGWLMMLYELPLLNGIMMPAVMAVVASRIVDIEHKGSTWKFLETVQDKSSIFKGKVLCGIVIIMLFCILQMVSVIMSGIILDYEGKPDIWAYGLYFAETLLISFAVFMLQMILSVFFTNQMAALSIGLCGSMAGLFLMFMPQWPLLRKILIWGCYGAAMFVGMDWDSITRISYFYYMDVDISAIICVIMWIVILYVTGKKKFTGMEV